MKIIVAIAAGFFGLVPSVFAASSAQDGSKMKLGDPIPAVTVPNQDGKPVNLAEEGKTGYTLVYFYPKAMSKGCTAQACSLRDSYTRQAYLFKEGKLVWLDTKASTDRQAQD